MVWITNAAVAISLVSSIMLVDPVASYGRYRALVPNAYNVTGIASIGHVNTSGTGARNEFGKAFAGAGYTWTVELCTADSDGDGQTNGQELGDPCCEWNTTNKVTRWVVGVSHPGDATKTSASSLWESITCSNNITFDVTVGDSESGSSSDAGTTATPAPTSGSSTTTTVITAIALITLLLGLTV